MKIPKNSYGFGIAGIMLAIFVVGLIGLIAWRVAMPHSSAKHAADSSKKSVSTAVDQNAAPAETPPAGFKLYADHSAGVQFFYPDVFGDFTEALDTAGKQLVHDYPKYDQILESGAPKAPYMPGLSGSFELYQFKKGDMETSSRKYGPDVKLEGDKWIVTKPNQYYNPENYKPDDEYDEMTLTNVHGLNVYTAKSGDEGVIQYNLYFVTGGRLRQLSLPEFDTGTYGGSPTINDQTLYDGLCKQVVQSINLY